MSHPSPNAAGTARWKRPVYLAVVAAAFALVWLAWMHIPTVDADSESSESGTITLTCANGGPSRWAPPTVREGQELMNGDNYQTFNLQVIKNDIESVRFGLACEQARATHTNTLIVTTFAAGAALFFGYHGLWKRREPSTRP